MVSPGTGRILNKDRYNNIIIIMQTIYWQYMPVNLSTITTFMAHVPLLLSWHYTIVGWGVSISGNWGEEHLDANGRNICQLIGGCHRTQRFLFVVKHTDNINWSWSCVFFFFFFFFCGSMMRLWLLPLDFYVCSHLITFFVLIKCNKLHSDLCTPNNDSTTTIPVKGIPLTCTINAITV